MAGRLTLLVIADPSARFLTALSQLPDDVRVLICDQADEIRAKVSDADVILYAHTDADLLLHVLPLAGRLNWIHSLWTGVEGILGPPLKDHPAPLTNGRGVFRWPLADWVTAALLFFAFDLRRIIDQQGRSEWKPFTGTTLNGRSLGIVGYGAVGAAIAARASSFGMNIGAMRRRPELSAGDSLLDRSYGPAGLKELMATSDYVVVVTPLTTETRGMIGEAEIAVMKSSAVIINVGRGPVIDEAALIRALESYRIRGAALDVFNVEPLPPGHPFWRMPNVLLSPHTADRVEGFLEPAFACFFENLNRFRNGVPLMNVVDKQAGY